MKHSLALMSLSLLFVFPVFSEGRTKGRSQSNEMQTPALVSVTGCVDQQDGVYVLTDDRTGAEIALHAEGFEQEGFAKHVGETVTVRGQIESGGDFSQMRVRSVHTVANSCAAPGENPL